MIIWKYDNTYNHSYIQIDNIYWFIFKLNPNFIQDMGRKLSEYIYLLNGGASTGQNNALIVPAFESERYRIDSLPGTKADLIKQLDIGEIIR